MFAQADLRLAKGPILIAHQAKHGQQLRLGKPPLAEFRALGGKTARLTSRANRANRPSPISAISKGEEFRATSALPGSGPIQLPRIEDVSRVRPVLLTTAVRKVIGGANREALGS
jgi:hypothetical protein